MCSSSRLKVGSSRQSVSQAVMSLVDASEEDVREGKFMSLVQVRTVKNCVVCERVMVGVE